MEIFKKYVEPGSHLVFSWNQQVNSEKKISRHTKKIKEDWATFAKKTEYVFDKDDSFLSPSRNQQLRTLDLHGFFSLTKQTRKLKNFIN